MLSFRIVNFPRKIYNRAKSSLFFRNIIVMASGTALAQIITFAFSPVVARIYGPAAFGFFGTFMAVTSIFIPIAALTYPTAIAMPRDDRSALGLVRLSIIISIAMALLVAVGLWLGGEWLNKILGTESIASFMFLIPLVIVFSVCVQVAEQWLIRIKGFGVIARSSVFNALITNVARTGIGYLHPVGMILIVLNTLAYAFHAALLFMGTRQLVARGASKQTADVYSKDKPNLKELAYRYRAFPLHRAPQILLNSISISMPVLMLASFFGSTAAGFYTLSSLVIGVPSNIIGKAVGDVFYPRIIEAARNSEDLLHHILSATCVLLAIGILPFGIVMLFGPYLFEFVFGADWIMAGEYGRWLALFFLFNFINKPFIAAAPVLGIQQGLLIYELFSTGAKILALMIGFYLINSDISAIALFAVTGAISYILLMLWIYLYSLGWIQNEKTG